MAGLKKTILIITASVTAAAILLAIIARSGNNSLSNMLNTVITPVWSMIGNAVKPVENLIEYIVDMKDLKQENESLKSELRILKKESRNSEEYKKENERLKKLLSLTDEMENCKTVPAKIVSFEPSNWFHTLVINKGENQGIKLSDVVITEEGLVGRISEVGTNWARVSTILDSGNAVGIKLKRTGDVGIAEGDAEFLKKRCFKLDYLSKEASAISGDLLETSGLGGIYPPGISVGTIEEIQLDNTGEIIKSVVRPSVSFDDLYEVLVITAWDSKEYDRQTLTEDGHGEAFDNEMNIQNEEADIEILSEVFSDEQGEEAE